MQNGLLLNSHLEPRRRQTPRQPVFGSRKVSGSRQFSRDIALACRYLDASRSSIPDNESDKAHYMSGFKEVSFADRQKAAQEARKNILDKFRAQPGADDPAVKQRQAEREAQAAARATAKLAREAEKAAKKAEGERLAAEAAAAAAREKEEAAMRETALEAERKAARDARYAARKKKRK
jgi:hypothetical protein